MSNASDASDMCEATDVSDVSDASDVSNASKASEARHRFACKGPARWPKRCELSARESPCPPRARHARPENIAELVLGFVSNKLNASGQIM